jgi:hypothetical protein
MPSTEPIKNLIIYNKSIEYLDLLSIQSKSGFLFLLALKYNETIKTLKVEIADLNN